MEKRRSKTLPSGEDALLQKCCGARALHAKNKRLDATIRVAVPLLPLLCLVFVVGRNS